MTEASSSPRTVRGTLRFSAYKAEESNVEPLRHTSVFVNGPGYAGMEDNDLRGFLDGIFKNGWNQSGQRHVRIGRRPGYPGYGEHELFRVLHRWADIELPPATKVLRTRLTLTVENGPLFDVSVLLYEVKKDWIPGEGGTQHDNTSPPKKGEVWWNDVGYLKKPWALPGASFASNVHPDADTAAMPLAEAHYHPGDQKLVFSSPELAHYFAERMRKRLPLLFLLKLSDYHEDHAASLLALYSGNHGHNRNLKRRPNFQVEWESRNGVHRLEKDIFLEYGRSYVLPRQDAKVAKFFAVSFETAPGYATPTIEIRTGHGQSVSSWRRVSPFFTADWDWVEIRLAAVVDPVVIREAFIAQARDTWVKTPLQNQEILWTFISPTAKTYKVEAGYLGKFTWQVKFHPQELGRWRYYWTHNLIKEDPYRSAPGVFDVIGGDMEHIKAQLQDLREQMRRIASQGSSRLLKKFERDFVQLERAALQLETPESFASKSHGDLYVLLKELRSLLWKGKPIPEPIPLRAFEREWNG